jgi:hypothetical protein
MCLFKITWATAWGDILQDSEGWKVFHVDQEQRLTGDMYGMDTVRPEGRWIHERDYREWDGKNQEYIRTRPIPSDTFEDALERTVMHNTSYYPTGWHIFEDYTDAEDLVKLRHYEELVIRPVSYKQAEVFGVVPNGSNQRGVAKLAPCVVAKQIYIYPKDTYTCPLKDKKEKK